MSNSNPFPYLGNFTKILPYEDMWEHIESCDDWEEVCSALNAHQYETRPQHEKDHALHYGPHNHLYARTIVKDKGFFSNQWFDAVGADPDGGYFAQIYRTSPGNIESPHVDFFPSFLGDRDPDGNLWTPESVTEVGKKVIRCWIPLMDGKVGHILYSDNYAMCDWKLGDVYELPAGVTHGFVNGGIEDRYVCVFTSWRKNHT